MSDDDLISQIRRNVQKIAMMSHVSAPALERATPSTDDDVGGRRPPGGIDGADDWHPDAAEFGLKSADYFQRKLDGTFRRAARPLHQAAFRHELQALLEESKQVLEAWSRTPLPSGQDPEYGSPQWKRWIAESLEESGELARKYAVSRQYIHKVRRDYQDRG